MPAKSSNAQYGAVGVSIHWLTAILILFQFITGFRASGMLDSAAKADLLWFHAPVGNAILILTIARVIWWWFFDKRPAPSGNDPHWQELAAKAVHVLFYVLIIALAASGVAMIGLSGADEVIFDGHDAPLPDFFDYGPRIPHGVGARLMAALLILHVGAALFHHFMRKDGTLGRMWYRQ